MIPKLRFAEFTAEWSPAFLGDVASVTKLAGFEFTKHIQYSEEGKIIAIRGLNVKGLKLDLSDVKFIDNSDFSMLGRSKLYKGDIIFTYVGTIGNTALIPENDRFYLAPNVALVRMESALNTFMVQLLHSDIYYKKEIIKHITSSSQPALSMQSIRKFNVVIPSINEQLKIAHLLSTVDQKINLFTKKKEALETYKKGLMQKIFSQEFRFKREDGTDYPEWKSYKLKEVLIEHKKRSDGSEQVHSVSVHKGVVNQIEHLGRSFAAKDVSNYNKVLFGDVIYTKSPTGDFPYGIIKQSYVHNAIVSPLYCVTSPIDINIGYLLNWFFESNINVHNYLHPIVQKGAKNTISITNSTFLSRSLFLPSDKAERQKIKDVYSSLNDNLRTLESEILKVTEFKKGLLQQMFV